MKHQSLSDEEMKQFYVRDNTSELERMPTTTVAYDRDGKALDSVEDKRCVARTSTDPATGSMRYFVKRAVFGADAPHLFNPQSVNYRHGDEYMRQQGLPKYNWLKVSQACFQEYLRFLMSKNQKYLRIAERELDS